MTDKKDKGGVHSFFNKLTRLKMIPDRDNGTIWYYGTTHLTG